MKRTASRWHEFGVKAELAQPSEQAVDGFLAVGAVEVCGAEVAPVGLVAQHVPGGGKHGGCHSEDRLLGTTSGADAWASAMHFSIIASLLPLAAFAVPATRTTAAPAMIKEQQTLRMISSLR